MTEATQPRMARGTKLPLAVLAAALFALLAFAPLASATPDPVSSGTTTVTLNKGWTKYLKTFGIKIQKVGNAKVKGNKVTFKVRDPKKLDVVNVGDQVQITYTRALAISVQPAPAK